MRTRTIETKRTLTQAGVSALLTMLSLAAVPFFLPDPASAQVLTADAQLYEMSENAKFQGKGDGRRKATSQLMGWAKPGTPLCPLSALRALGVTPRPCVVTATGSDDIDLGTGLGDFSGNVKIVVQGDNPTDSPELVIAKGRFKGDMDFSPAILHGIPYGTVVGKIDFDWNVPRQPNGPIPFTGIFRLPFVLPGVPDAAIAPLVGPLPLTPFPTFSYVGQTSNGQSVCTMPDPLASCTRPVYILDIDAFIKSNGQRGWGPVLATEYALGYPTVRFDIKF